MAHLGPQWTPQWALPHGLPHGVPRGVASLDRVPKRPRREAAVRKQLPGLSTVINIFPFLEQGIFYHYGRD